MGKGAWLGRTDNKGDSPGSLPFPSNALLFRRRGVEAQRCPTSQQQRRDLNLGPLPLDHYWSCLGPCWAGTSP